MQHSLYVACTVQRLRLVLRDFNLPALPRGASAILRIRFCCAEERRAPDGSDVIFEVSGRDFTASVAPYLEW